MAHRTASVSLRDLANDLAYWISRIDAHLECCGDHITAPLEGLRSLEEVIRGYDGAGFTIGSEED